ncbi:hypothetical protein [Streptomyces sp. NPDC093225]|uniref:hypothetical protein n=1 Tax=Streptomyces sp. NPDC093225 TaxID=3366034 RepID=UPI003829F6EE
MPDQPSALSADQTAAASSLLRVLADCLKTSPDDEAEALARHLLAHAGLLSDIQHLLSRLAWWVDSAALPNTDDGPRFDARCALDAASAEVGEALLLAENDQLFGASTESHLAQTGQVASSTPPGPAVGRRTRR